MEVKFYPEDLKAEYQTKGANGVDQKISTREVTADKLNEKAQAILRIVGRAVFHSWDRKTYNAVHLPVYDRHGVLELALKALKFRLKDLGSKRFMGELKAVAEDNKISEDEMFKLCKEVFLGENKKESIAEKGIEELDLSTRAYNCLKSKNINTIGELIQKTDAELFSMRYTGPKSINEIKSALNALGLSFAERKKK